MSTTQQPSKTPWLLINLVALVGLGLSAYLTYIHVGVHTNPTFTSGCNINQTFNCESVALSSYAVIANLPTSVWGLLGYLLVLLVGLVGWRRTATTPSPLHGLIFLLSLACLAAGAFFAYVSFTQIKALCIHCMGTYFANFILFGLALWALRHDQVSVGQSLHSLLHWLPRNLLALITPAFLVVVLILGYPKYWLPQWNGVALPFQTCGMPTADSQMAHGEEDGVHWLGSKNPSVRIVEFADYECPFCQRAHFNLRALLRKCPKAIRLYHRHYPLDHACNPRIHRPFHQKACLLAKAAYCAGKQGKFWEANDYLYTQGKKVEASQIVESLASVVKIKGDQLQTCIQSQQASQELDKDMQAGRDLKMEGTPFFVMNEVAYREGTIPNDAILKALETANTPPVKAATPVKTTPTPVENTTQTTPSTQSANAPQQVPARPDPKTRQAPDLLQTPKPPTFRPLTPPNPTNPTPNR